MFSEQSVSTPRPPRLRSRRSGQARPATPVNGDVVAPPRPAVPSANAAPAAPPAEATVAVIAESSLKAVLSNSRRPGPTASPTARRCRLRSPTLARSSPGSRPTPGFDVVISASIDDIKTLTDRTLVLPTASASLARNSVVIYGRKALLKDDDLEWFDLVGSEWKKVALGKPDLVSSGRVAQRALQKRGLINDDNKDVFTYGMTDSLARRRRAARPGRRRLRLPHRRRGAQPARLRDFSARYGRRAAGLLYRGRVPPLAQSRAGARLHRLLRQ
ncbi:MAG: substrate-binding domain-containing protein [Verrucomicrobiota bacterium]